MSVTLSKDIKAKVAGATVKLCKLGGQGVLVEGDLILTAAHCITVTGVGSGNYEDILNRIETNDGSQLLVETFAVEPVADIAVLGCVDYQDIPDWAEKFETFCENTTPLPICCREFPLSQPFPIFIYDHKEKWITGTARQMQKNARGLPIVPDQRIEGGTSGSPVVNDTGELLGIVSRSGETHPNPDSKQFSLKNKPLSLHGFILRPHLVLPVWVVQQILSRKGDKEV